MWLCGVALDKSPKVNKYVCKFYYTYSRIYFATIYIALVVVGQLKSLRIFCEFLIKLRFNAFALHFYVCRLPFLGCRASAYVYSHMACVCVPVYVCWCMYLYARVCLQTHKFAHLFISLYSMLLLLYFLFRFLICNLFLRLFIGSAMWCMLVSRLTCLQSSLIWIVSSSDFVCKLAIIYQPLRMVYRKMSGGQTLWKKN